MNLLRVVESCGSGRSCPQACSRFREPNGRRFCREELARAIAPAKIEATLDELERLGLIDGWDVAGGVVHVESDRVTCELAVASLDVVEPDPRPQTRPTDVAHRKAFGQPASPPTDHHRVAVAFGRADYFRRCEHLQHTPAYRHLTKVQRAIWRLHAAGGYNSEVAKETGATLKKVRVTITTCRKLCGLPETTSTIGHGVSTRAPKPQPHWDAGRRAARG